MPKSNFLLIFGTNILFIPMTFFSVLSILSIEYEGAENSKAYIFGIIVSAFIFYSLLLKRLLLRKRFSVEPIFLGISFLIVINAILVSIFLDIPSVKFIYQFFLLVLPAFFFGMELGLKDKTSSVSQLFLFVSVIVTTSVIILVPKMLLVPTNELMTFFGGGQYQAFSYSVSISYMISFVYYSFYLDDQRSRLGILFILMFIIQILGIALSGGRGGIGIVLLGTVWVLFIKYPFFKLIRILLIFIAIVTFFGFIVLMSLEDYTERIFESSARLFSFISADGFDFQQTSNRDLVYIETMKTIGKSPVFGYGIFGYLKETNFAYPHNFFLEILLQGGLILFVCWIGLFFIFWRKLLFLIRSGNNHKFLLVTFTYSFVHLMFSATYLLEPFFWFNLAYVFTASNKKWAKTKISQ